MMAAQFGWSWSALVLRSSPVVHVSFWRSQTLGLARRLAGGFGVPCCLAPMALMAQMVAPWPSPCVPIEHGSKIGETPIANSYDQRQATEVLSHWCDFLRPREFSVRLDVKMKRGAAPYPRNPYKKRPVPKVKGIIRKLIK